MEYLSVVFFHILAGVLWAGGAVLAGFFIVPAVLDAGPAGGAVMAGITKRKLPIYLTVLGAISVLTGARLYSIRFTPGWLTSPEGMALTLGALLALVAMGFGIFIQRPAAERLGALAAKIAASGGPPSPAQKAEMEALRARLGRIGTVTAWHLLGAAALMSMHRLLAAL